MDARPEVKVSRGVGTDGSSVVTEADDARLLRRLAATADAHDDVDDDDVDGGEKAEQQQRGGATSGVRRRRRRGRSPSSSGGVLPTPIIIVFGDDPVVSSSPRCLLLSDERMGCFGDAIIAGGPKLSVVDTLHRGVMLSFYSIVKSVDFRHLSQNIMISYVCRV